MKYIDNWKNRNVFIKQSELNKKELNGNYPPHWFSFLKIVSTIDNDIKKMLDIGCGTGVYYELCRKHFKNIDYVGVDYSEDAIDIAKNIWKYEKFYVKDFNDIEKTFIEEYDIIHLGALLDVLPNGNEALDFILKLGTKYVILSRVDLSNKNECDTYLAYDEIITYKYKHGQDDLIKIIQQNKYNIIMVDGNNILLKIDNRDD